MTEMLRVGQRVIVREDLPVDTNIVLGIDNRKFFVPRGIEQYSGQTVTIEDVHFFTKEKDGTIVYYYRIREDAGDFVWLASFFDEIDIKDFYLIHMKDDNYFVLQKSNIENITFMRSFENLTEEVEKKCQIL